MKFFTAFKVKNWLPCSSFYYCMRSAFSDSLKAGIELTLSIDGRIIGSFVIMFSTCYFPARSLLGDLVSCEPRLMTDTWEGERKLALLN